jgi:hypothetical protein
VIYQTGFEAPDYSLGALTGQDGWQVFGGTVPAVQDVVVKDGTQAAAVYGGLNGQSGPYHTDPSAANRILVEADVFLASSSNQGAWQFAALGSGLGPFFGGVNFQANGNIQSITQGYGSLGSYSRDAWMRYAPGGRSDYDVVMAGFKYNMMDLQAAIGLHQLARLEERLARREAIWAAYDRAFARLPLRLPVTTLDGDRHARHIYGVLVDERAAGMSRDALQQRLADRGVSTSIHFRALHLHPYYQQRFGYARGMFPADESISDSTLSLPRSAANKQETVERVI